MASVIPNGLVNPVPFGELREDGKEATTCQGQSHECDNY